MEASQGTQTGARSCTECSTPNLPMAQFCKACGASIAPPPKCPKCEVDVDPDSKFCPSCGTKLVGARADAPKNGATPSVAKSHDKKAKRDLLDSEKAKLPAKKPTSNMSANAALFIAVIAVMGVAMYVVNKGKPKEMSPFAGGPPPAMGQPPPPSADPAMPSGDPIKGEIVVDPSLQGSASGGTLFIVVRNQGMPNQGPPLAVRKIDNPKFPASFQIAASDVMMPGIPFVGPFDLYVRLDQDGNAMTKAPGDLMNGSPASGIKAGSTDVKITLDKKL